MHVHFIAPERHLRASHEIIRHPRLRATAKTLLLWALSLPPGSRETVLTIGNRMPEGRTAVSRARSQLIEEGYLHVRRVQHPTRGTWTTRILVSSVPLTEPQEVEAAWHGAVRNPALGEGRGRDVGTSPQREKSEGKTSLPGPAVVPTTDESQVGAAAMLLGRLTARDGRLRLGAVETLELAPLVADWLARDADVGRLRDALLSGLPPAVLSPAGLVRSRLERKMPAPPGADRGLGVPAVGECGHCAAPVAGGGVICRCCAGVAPPPVAAPDPVAVERNRRGAARVRSLLRGGAVAAGAV
ncbi:hypothetical protein GCM10009665_15860 [Kitasatospora nipponensis]|uniref:Helix-turn-helix domain-containing protein n=1 Tax=Kitasatospora nipponensis TaxID=258049 RepID=A0ABP4GIL9_9ACTN